jgi:hypothetical protein
LNELFFFRGRSRRKRLLMVGPDKSSDRIAKSGPDGRIPAQHLRFVY